jgi:hypothetical protein
MLGLYFLGPALERAWGPRQFFLVYTIGGVFGNVILTFAGAVHFIDPLSMGVGASGSVLTLLGAAAVLFPQAQVLVYFLIPVRIRTAVIAITALYIFNVFRQGSNYGGDICHLGGLAVGFFWARSGGWSISGRHRTAPNPNSIFGRIFGSSGAPRGGGGAPRRTGQGAWKERMRQRQTDEATIDRILAKIQDKGIWSLSESEKRALNEATERRKRDEERMADDR